jgi:hypothetical protein
MIEKLHDHMVEELKANARTDTVFIIVAIFMNLIALAINWSVTAWGGKGASNLIIAAIFIVLVVIVNLVVILGLTKGKQTRLKLLGGLSQMYEDQGISKYYDKSISASYGTRYTLFIVAVSFTGATAIIVPLVSMFLK